MTTFTHHPFKAPEDWAFDPARTYSQDKSWCKPVGFWLSVDDDWNRWCKGDAMLEWIVPGVTFDVDTDQCLWLRTVEDIDRFDREYVGDQTPYKIDWRPLTEQYAGIIIAPYQWQRRLSMTCFWYYPWDCASACIWDLDVVRMSETVAVSE